MSTTDVKTPTRAAAVLRSAQAVDAARAALLEESPHGIGDYLGTSPEPASPGALTLRFASTLPGYLGWEWAVVVGAAPRAKLATISEVALLPGLGAIVAPPFEPWEGRIRPGDLSPGELLPHPVDDARLAPGYILSDDPYEAEVAGEIGLGRAEVLSREGRLDAADRWQAGEFGPESDMAKAAEHICGECGFFLPLAGSLQAAFGVCANKMAADGRVVHADHGCGAHSEVLPITGMGNPVAEPYDDEAADFEANISAESGSPS